MLRSNFRTLATALLLPLENPFDEANLLGLVEVVFSRGRHVLHAPVKASSNTTNARAERCANQCSSAAVFLVARGQRSDPGAPCCPNQGAG